MKLIINFMINGISLKNQNKLFVFGGRKIYYSFLQSIELSDLEGNDDIKHEWSTISNMKYGVILSGIKYFPHKSNVIIIGGYSNDYDYENQDKLFMMYDMSKNECIE